MVHYQKGNFIVRDSIEKDIQEIADNMRQSDIKEIWASHHYKPLEALKISFRDSILCMTVELDGKAIAMFGASPEGLFSKRASVWLLASDELTKIQRIFIKQSRAFINYMLTFYPYLYNYCYAKNKKTIKWLRFCGASFLGEIPFGVEKEMFNYFVFQRSKQCV